MTRLEVSGLELRFGGVVALGGVSFTVEAGERVALVGPNGAGKTSVLNCLSGAVRPSAGRVVFAGRDLARVPPHRRAALGMARTLQGLGLVDDLDVIGNLMLGRHALMRAGVLAGALRLPWARSEERVHHRQCEQVAAELGLEPSAPVPALRAGERKRLELGRVLAAEPSLLLLDEPFAGAGADDVAVMVAAIGAARAAAVIVDHDVGTVVSLADRVVRLEAGRVVRTRAA